MRAVGSQSCDEHPESQAQEHIAERAEDRPRTHEVASESEEYPDRRERSLADQTRARAENEQCTTPRRHRRAAKPAPEGGGQEGNEQPEADHRISDGATVGRDDMKIARENAKIVEKTGSDEGGPDQRENRANHPSGGPPSSRRCYP